MIKLIAELSLDKAVLRTIRPDGLLDVFTREAMAIEVGSRLRGENVANVRRSPRLPLRPTREGILRQWRRVHRTDHGLWAYTHKVKMDFSRPRAPTDNAHIKSFNGSIRDELLNMNWFSSIAEAQRLAEASRRHYNESRPHMGQNSRTPREFAELSSLCHRDDMKMAAGF
ncbi:hypothetical protein GCM10007854_30530 [Algimonas porphyrae]|uniref:Integrase catalytic domain-containing protein n=1 Tax=Algimonas porphyrae TaxID=1128113 RepID=A0ABQ5V3L6_9PROT|nr:hypothetical protein GCM10007854_30530 [Algimonas porphyrae]